MQLKYFVLILSINFVYSQINTIPIILPSNCTTSQYYSISNLQCLSCPANSATNSINPYNCACNSNARYFRNYGGGVVQCSTCPTNTTQSTNGGWSCVTCGASCKTCSLSQSFLSEIGITNGVYAPTQQLNCFTCNSATIPTQSNSCKSCYNVLYTDSSVLDFTNFDCTCSNGLNSGGLCFLNMNSQLSGYPTNFQVTFDSASVTSLYFQTHGVAAYLQCLNTANNRNATACQILGNMCTLLLYNPNLVNAKDLCNAFYSITSNENTYWPVNMPWLVYTDTYGSYMVNAQTQLTTLTLSGSRCTSNPLLSFYAAKYRMNGTLISFGVFDLGELQLCTKAISALGKSLSGSFIDINYVQSCKISANDLMKYSTNEPVFYDLYLKFQNSSSLDNLLPVPVVFTNYIDLKTGSPINNNSNVNSYKMFRRFFLTDRLSSISNQGDSPQYIRYAQSIIINFTLFNGDTTGRINPPVIYVTYAYFNVKTGSLNTLLPINFQVDYSMNLDTQVQNIWISAGVIAIAGLFWAFIRTWIWNKRSGKLTIDLITLLKFFAYICGSFGNVAFIVMFGVSLWWLIFFKAQGVAYVVLPKIYQVLSFEVILVLALVLKLIDVVHLIFSQTSFDIFFIDWEKPKIKEDKNSVSCWRVLFVANEWNEIQTFRKTNTTLQLMIVLLFLKVINLEAICTDDCNTGVTVSSTSYTASQNSILRVGMACSIYVGIGLLQWFLYTFLYSRMIQDKLCEFVDLCSVSNVSVFIMSNAQYGYYIHGRSPNGTADTNIKQMTVALEKESNDLVAKRGLLPDTQQQVFSMSLISKLRKQYTKVMQPLYERRALRPDENSKDIFNKYMDAYSQLNKFLMAFIDHSLRDIDYMVDNRNLIENVFDLELKDPIVRGYFYADPGTSYENVLFFGKERVLFIFELLVFLVVDYFAQNYVLAAFIVFIVYKILQILRNDLGKRNLSKKTLVDKRFLI